MVLPKISNVNSILDVKSYSFISGINNFFTGITNTTDYNFTTKTVFLSHTPTTTNTLITTDSIELTFSCLMFAGTGNIQLITDDGNLTTVNYDVGDTNEVLIDNTTPTATTVTLLSVSSSFTNSMKYYINYSFELNE